MNKVTVGIIAVLTLLVGSLSFWQLDPIDLHTTDCSYLKLKQGMNDEQKQIFDIFVEADFCEIGNCETGMLYPEMEQILKKVWEANPEFHRRIVYYIEECKDKNG